MANLGRFPGRFPVGGGRISLNVEFVDEVGCDGRSRIIDAIVDHRYSLLGQALFSCSLMGIASLVPENDALGVASVRAGAST